MFLNKKHSVDVVIQNRNDEIGPMLIERQRENQIPSTSGMVDQTSTLNTHTIFPHPTFWKRSILWKQKAIKSLLNIN
jgi:hypothetical protein